MPSDLKFTQLEKAGTDTGPLVVLDNDLGPVIRVASLMPDIDKNTLNTFGVVELMHKLLQRCNEVQTKVNEGVKTGERLTSFPAITYSAPRKDTDGELRTQSTQQLITKLTVRGDSIIGVVS